MLAGQVQQVQAGALEDAQFPPQGVMALLPLVLAECFVQEQSEQLTWESLEMIPGGSQAGHAAAPAGNCGQWGPGHVVTWPVAPCHPSNTEICCHHVTRVTRVTGEASS